MHAPVDHHFYSVHSILADHMFNNAIFIIIFSFLFTAAAVSIIWALFFTPPPPFDNENKNFDLI